jgi:sec-independent protein translocase protein TatB
MFDIASSKLLILAIVALLVIGPKDLPALLRTVGKYVGIIKKHAAEFRAQFDEAIREAELDELRKDVEKIGHETQSSMREATDSVEKQLAEARESVDSVMTDKPASAPSAPALGSDIVENSGAVEPVATPADLNGAAHRGEGEAAMPNETGGSPGESGVKSGA